MTPSSFNESEIRPSRLHCALLYCAQVLMMPIFGSLEAAGVFMAIVSPETGFHVIKKSGSTGEGHADDGMNAPGGPDKVADPSNVGSTSAGQELLKEPAGVLHDSEL